jgi:hypothetical protein
LLHVSDLSDLSNPIIELAYSPKLTVSSALLLLHEAHASRNSETSEHFERVHHTKAVTDNVIKSREEMGAGFEAPIRSCVRAASPFMTTLLYQMATANLRRCQALKLDESYEAFMVLKEGLKLFDGRWRASGEINR